MSVIKFGSAGLGPAKDAISNLEMFHELGLKACEISFTYGPYIKSREDALKIGRVAKKLGIFLSIHAPYFVNLNSKEEEKIESSKKRILKCCEVGSWLGVKRVIFHPGFYSGMESIEAGVRIKESILEMQEVIKKNKWDIELCPEVMGKVNVFGSIDEVADLVDSTGCGFCIDIAHVLARYGRYEFDKIKDAFKAKKWHIHFSGIEYGEKGEKRHLMTSVEDWKRVLKFLKNLDKDVVLICESPDTVGDSVVGKKIWKDL
ncbi:MAG: TIM barrel protein [Candidatus Peregrinibacteria bacterium]|nr:TIM barrel protein [Candidatus Peregrinibacteria bacterium]